MLSAENSNDNGSVSGSYAERAYCLAILEIGNICSTFQFALYVSCASPPGPRQTKESSPFWG